MNINELRSNLQEEQNPVLAATDIGFFISDSLGNGSITLWEAFLLSDLQRDLLRNGYLKPAWSHSIGFSDLLSIIMLYVMSCYFNEPLLAAKHQKWLTEAMNNLKDTRNHYARRLAPLVQNGEDASLFLQLAEVRRNAKPFDKGPYHDEVFPFSHLSPEEEIIKNNSHSEKLISLDLSSLIANLTIAYG